MDKKNPDHKLTIRNSTAEFLIFTQQAGEKGIEAHYEDGTIWLTQKHIAELFGVDVRTVNEHLQNIFESQELDQNSVIRKFRITASDGKNYNSQFYNLDAIISVGYRVNSKRATQFRQWATQVLHQFAIKGYVLDKKRLENGNFLGEDYFEQLLAAYLELAEDRAKRKIPMTMEDWAKRLDKFLEFDERDVLKDAGKISAKIAKDHAESEFEKYRIVQDRHFESDFDREIKAVMGANNEVRNGKTWITYGWIFEKLKTKKGCDSYFDSCTPTYEKYLQEKAGTKQLLSKN